MVSHQFSTAGAVVPPNRTIDNDAPAGLRHELVDLLFHIAEHNDNQQPTPDRVYRVACQSFGAGVAGNPYGGYRYKVSQAIEGVNWTRVYDLILRFVPDFSAAGRFDVYREGVNQLLAAHGIVWDLGANGRLVRVLPAEAQAQVSSAIQELSDTRFAPALALLNSALDAYDDRPQRDRDACSNAFDAMESVAKEKHAMPTATFGQVLQHIRQTNALHGDITGVFERINTLRNQNFGHGMTTPFALTGAEVDFTYLGCVAGILLFARTP